MNFDFNEVDIDLPGWSDFLFDSHRVKVVHSGRGATKTWNFARALLILGGRKRILVLCCRETMHSMKESVHRTLSEQISLMGMQEFYEIQESKIIGENGTEFIFAGLRNNVHNIKSTESVDIAWVEEAQGVSKNSWETLEPTIRKKGSEIWISFNPALLSDPTYQMWVLKPPPYAKVVKISWRDNEWLTKELRDQMEHCRATDPPKFAHVWEGEPSSIIEGAVYGDQLLAVQTSGRIAPLAINRTLPIHTFWDLGFGDSTAIWFAQALPGGTYHLVDYMEDSGKTIDWYLMELQKKGYLYGQDWLPHDGVDAIIHSRLGGGDKSRSIEMIMRGAGRNVRISPKINVLAGINAVRQIMGNCRFDSDRCIEGLDALRHYQWGPEDEKTGLTKRVPLHDWSSHGSDAFRTFATSVKTPIIEPKNPHAHQGFAHNNGADAWMA